MTTFRRRNWLAQRKRTRVLVHTPTGTHDGILLASHDDCVELVQDTFTANGTGPVSLQGPVFVPRETVLFVQGVPHAARDR